MDIRTRVNEHRVRSLGLALAVPLALLLAGCPPTTPTGDEGDGRRCDAADAKDAVYVEVTYDASGMPEVAPSTCTIDRGTQVTWRGPAGTQVPFEIRFKGASPLSRDRGALASSTQGERYRVRQTFDAPAGRYEYGVLANGKELDPAIIIR